jgi:hypothetical protein
VVTRPATAVESAGRPRSLRTCPKAGSSRSMPSAARAMDMASSDVNSTGPAGAARWGSCAGSAAAVGPQADRRRGRSTTRPSRSTSCSRSASSSTPRSSSWHRASTATSGPAAAHPLAVISTRWRRRSSGSRVRLTWPRGPRGRRRSRPCGSCPGPAGRRGPAGTAARSPRGRRAPRGGGGARRARRAARRSCRGALGDLRGQVAGEARTARADGQGRRTWPEW